MLEVQQALTITLPPTTRDVNYFFIPLLEVQQALTITLSSITRGYKRCKLFLYPLAGSTTCLYHHLITHNKRVQEEYPLPIPTYWKYSMPLPSPYHPKQEGTKGLSSFHTCWKYSMPLPSIYHPQQEGTRGVSSLFPHLLEVQQALTITQSPTTREQEDYLLPFPACWKYSTPLPSHYHPQQEGIRAVFSSLPHLLEVQQAHTITIAPTTRRYKRSIFLNPLARSIAGPYHHLTTHNKEYPLPFPTCWKYSRPLLSP